MNGCSFAFAEPAGAVAGDAPTRAAARSSLPVTGILHPSFVAVAGCRCNAWQRTPYDANARRGRKTFGGPFQPPCELLCLVGESSRILAFHCLHDYPLFFEDRCSDTWFVL